MGWRSQSLTHPRDCDPNPLPVPHTPLGIAVPIPGRSLTHPRDCDSNPWPVPRARSHIFTCEQSEVMKNAFTPIQNKKTNYSSSTRREIWRAAPIPGGDLREASPRHPRSRTVPNGHERLKCQYLQTSLDRSLGPSSVPGHRPGTAVPIPPCWPGLIHNHRSL